MLQIFAGFVMVLFHITVNNFDMMPDFLGYALIFWGAGRMMMHSRAFAHARPLAAGMGVVTALVAIGRMCGVSFTSPIFTAINLVTILVWLLILWFIIAGLQDIERDHGVFLGTNRLRLFWYIAAALNVVGGILPFLPDGTASAAMAFVVFSSLIVNVLFLIFFYRTKAFYDLAASQEK